MKDRYFIVYELTNVFPSKNTYCGEVEGEKGLKPFLQDLINRGATNIRIGKKIDFEVDIKIS